MSHQGPHKAVPVPCAHWISLYTAGSTSICMQGTDLASVPLDWIGNHALPNWLGKESLHAPEEVLWWCSGLQLYLCQLVVETCQMASVIGWFYWIPSKYRLYFKFYLFVFPKFNNSNLFSWQSDSFCILVLMWQKHKPSQFGETGQICRSTTWLIKLSMHIIIVMHIILSIFP